MGTVARRYCSMALVALLLVVHASQATGSQYPVLRVLFIGNSYLYTNNLPRVVQELASMQGRVIDTTLHAEPDYSLSDHLRNRRLDSLLEQDWDWVVLQQGPSALPSSRRQLVESARRMSARFEGRPARIALISAWPAQRNVIMSPQAETSTREAAADIDACILPAAGAWRIARAQPNPPELYAADQLHPAPRGTLLAAMTVVRGLIGLEHTQPLQARGMEKTDIAEFRRLDDAAREAQQQESTSCPMVVVVER